MFDRPLVPAPLGMKVIAVCGRNEHGIVCAGVEALHLVS
jgi:hypothetical protein